MPLLVIPGGGDAARLGAGEFDPLPVYNHIMKWTGRINLPSRIPELMNRAFSQVRNGKLGPVLLELPRDTGNADVDDPEGVYVPPKAYRSAGDPSDVAEAVSMLLSAKRPVLHAGHGVLWAQAWDELRELAELLQIPVVTTMAGKSAFPEDHPLALGAGGHSMTETAAHFLVKSDLVFGVGCSFAKGSFSFPIPAGKTIVQVVSDGTTLDKDHKVSHAVIGDAKLVLRQVIDEIKASGKAKKHEGVADEVKSAKDAFLDTWLPRLTADTAPISPYRVIWDLVQNLDRKNVIITHDSGNPRDQTLPFFEVVAPRGYLGWGKSTQLGTGYGMALGAKLAFPEKTCINIMGDLAFGTAGMEIETAFREKLPIITVLLNNSRLGGYSNYMPVASDTYNSNKLTGDYTAMAKGLGAYSEKVEKPEDVKGAIERGPPGDRRRAAGPARDDHPGRADLPGLEQGAQGGRRARAGAGVDRHPLRSHPCASVLAKGCTRVRDSLGRGQPRAPAPDQRGDPDRAQRLGGQANLVQQAALIRVQRRLQLAHELVDLFRRDALRVIQWHGVKPAERRPSPGRCRGRRWTCRPEDRPPASCLLASIGAWPGRASRSGDPTATAGRHPASSRSVAHEQRANAPRTHYRTPCASCRLIRDSKHISISIYRRLLQCRYVTLFRNIQSELQPCSHNFPRVASHYVRTSGEIIAVTAWTARLTVVGAVAEGRQRAPTKRVTVSWIVASWNGLAMNPSAAQARAASGPSVEAEIRTTGASPPRSRYLRQTTVPSTRGMCTSSSSRSTSWSRASWSASAPSFAAITEQFSPRRMISSSPLIPRSSSATRTLLGARRFSALM